MVQLNEVLTMALTRLWPQEILHANAFWISVLTEALRSSRSHPRFRPCVSVVYSAGSLFQRFAHQLCRHSSIMFYLSRAIWL